MSVYSVKPRFRRSLAGVEGLLVARGVTADVVTTAGLGCAAGAAAAVVGGGWWLLAVPPLVVTRLCCNALDGMIASDTGTARPLGLIYNEVSDRASDAVILLAVGISSDQVLLGGVAVCVALITSHLGVASHAAGGTRQYGGVMGKADRMVLLAAVVVLAAVFPTSPILVGYLVAVTAGGFVTFAQRTHAIRLEQRRLALR